MRTYARSLLIALGFLAAPALSQSQLVELEKPRFRPTDGGVVAITPGVTLDSGERGTFLAEFAFQSDLLVPGGGYSFADAIVFWRIAFTNGDVVLGNGTVLPSAEWNGVLHPVSVTIVSFEAATGAGRASIAIPFGGLGPEGTMARFPLLPEGGTHLTVNVGWKGKMRLDSSGLPTGVLAHSTLSFDSQWPDVWIGNEDFQGDPQVGDSEYRYLLRLRRSPATERTFRVCAQPEGIVEVIDEHVSITGGAQEAFAYVRIEGVELGQFRLEVRESEVLVARSAVAHVRQARVVRFGGAEAYVSASARGAAGVPDVKLAAGEDCEPATCIDGASHPTYTICQPCRILPSPPDTCLGEQLPGQPPVPPGTIHRAGFCKRGTHRCYYELDWLVCDLYVFSSKSEQPCASLIYTLQVAPYGIGTSSGAIFYRSATCCSYDYDPTSPPSAIFAKDCFELHH